ncbi:conserved exported hypothetical protein [Xenorhabdus nematophila F1]|uniref:Secreted protein n=1 Tax=Xenorhabdus nematophila (strain ATCC 19061 / DSM 3370 / CCUG 14189 / LMG 1036 / NCIMB 9965 / AN6) TaxID=406817 RepID=D3VAE2_XENNA|nr:hypothetical protein; putative exported protein [Xenorhabdus nematophila ATCC 19061]CCW31716.1 conserved exported hypothetical protein [Xenorhabdus nematophila F1]CEE94503.1 hypothetical protein; putative exported protein [Xenorhabdus nematophila str. Anatoliense]CEF31816.1 hypothetical protein; putative exported protein [Xenorhabdus nematophila str. Websteri]CEK22274.1 hypothetical protein; putative exported protein [Xenorhabdus nematophila AN6/1]
MIIKYFLLALLSALRTFCSATCHYVWGLIAHRPEQQEKWGLYSTVLASHRFTHRFHAIGGRYFWDNIQSIYELGINIKRNMMITNNYNC